MAPEIVLQSATHIDVSADEESEKKSEITLKVLNAVHRDDAVTQRNLAKDLGVALGIANAVLKRCVDKGLVKVRHTPARRYAYYLTPTGFSEKSRLTARYLSNSLRFVRDARVQFVEIFKICLTDGANRIVLAGDGELAELARLCARELNITLVAVVDTQNTDAAIPGLSIVASLEAIQSSTIDAIVLTDTVSPQATFDMLTTFCRVAGIRLFAPRLLNVSEPPSTGEP